MFLLNSVFICEGDVKCMLLGSGFFVSLCLMVCSVSGGVVFFVLVV